MLKAIKFYLTGIALLGSTYPSNVIRLTHNDNCRGRRLPSVRSKPDLTKFDPVYIDKRAKQIAARYSAWHKSKNGRWLTHEEFLLVVSKATSKITPRYLPDLPLHHDLHDELFRDKKWLRGPRQRKPYLTLVH